MKSRYIVPLIAFLPLTAFAKWDVVGLGDGPSVGQPQGTAAGEFQRFVSQRDEKKGKAEDVGKNKPGEAGHAAGTSQFLGISDKAGEWWVANDSQAPWKDYIAPNTTDKQPSFHITETLGANDKFFVGLSMMEEMEQYTSEFRMANNLIPNAEVYFGLRKDSTPAVIHTETVGGVTTPLFGNDGHINTTEGLVYQGFSNPTVGADQRDINFEPALADFNQREQFEWIKYTVDPNSSGDIVFTIKQKQINDSDGNPVGTLDLTDWVAFFVLPDDQATIVGEDWTGGAIDDGNSALRTDDLVFSWTVDGKSGIDPTVPPRWDPDPDGDPPVTPLTLVPEPSSVLMLFSGFSLLLLRRSRKVA